MPREPRSGYTSQPFDLYQLNERYAKTGKKKPGSASFRRHLCGIFVTVGVRDAQSIVKDASPRSVLTAAFGKIFIPSQAPARFRDGCFPQVVGMMNYFTEMGTRGHLDGCEGFNEELFGVLVVGNLSSATWTS